MSINNSVDRIVTKKGIIQISTTAADGSGGSGTFQQKFVKKLEYIIDDSEVQRDRIDDSTPVFTRLGDVVGTFKFAFKDTIDMYDTADPATDTDTVSYWLEQIAAVNYPLITFIQTKQAPFSSLNKFARPIFTGRIMKITGGRDMSVAVEDVEIEGEITAFTSAIQTAS